MSLTRNLVERVLELQFDDLAQEDLSATRLLLLDHLGVAANGSTTDSGACIQRFALASGEGSSSIVGTSLSATPLYAAMANAVAAHSIEYDDVHSAASSHPGVVIFPAAFAAADLAPTDAVTFLAAVVAGYEVMCRIGRAANPPAHYARHFHPTGTTGHFGAAATAAMILGLSEDETVSCLGIAATMAAGSLEFLLDGAWTKRLHPAQAARNGLEAALMASHGFKGTEDGIGGLRGFLAGYSADPNPKEILMGWRDRPLEVRNTSIKAHTCCRYKQGPIDALLAIRAQHGLESHDVSRVTIGLLSVAEDIVWEPVAAKRRPRSVVEAQFSMPFGAAVALRAGRASLAEYDGSLFSDPEVLRIMDATHCVVDTELDRIYPQQWSGWAEVKTTDGRTFRESIDDPKGDPNNPLSPRELRSKFDELTTHVYSAGRRHEIADVVEGLGTASNLEELIAILPTDLG